MHAQIQKIIPFLWFNNKAKEAVDFYVSMFSAKYENSKILDIMYYDEESSKASGMPEGSIMLVSFKLAGQEFSALNGGDYFKFSGAISFVINCDSQEEVDYFWGKLSQDGEEGVCGWINHDKFGVTWQIVPTILTKLLGDPDQEKAKKVMKAMLKMKKINIEKLQKAYEEVE